MARRFAMALAMVLALVPVAAFGQTEKAPGVGVSVLVTTGGDLGVAVPIFAGERIRIEPVVTLDYERLELSAGALTREESELAWSVGSAFQYVLLSSADFRVFGGLELHYRSGSSEVMNSTTNGGVTVSEEENATFTALAILPHLAAELALPGSFFAGLRAGPGLNFVLDVEIEGAPAGLDASGFALGGYGRIDIGYYF